jgi:hypothetical protein
MHKPLYFLAGTFRVLPQNQQQTSESGFLVVRSERPGRCLRLPPIGHLRHKRHGHTINDIKMGAVNIEKFKRWGRRVRADPDRRRCRTQKTRCGSMAGIGFFFFFKLCCHRDLVSEVRGVVGCCYATGCFAEMSRNFFIILIAIACVYMYIKVYTTLALHGRIFLKYSITF